MTVRELMKQLAGADPAKQVRVLDLSGRLEFEPGLKYVDDTMDPVYLTIELNDGDPDVIA